MASIKKLSVGGQIKDISGSGAGVEVGLTRAVDHTFKEGEEFHFDTTLPTRKDLKAIVRLVHRKESQTAGKIFLGLEFTEMSDDSRSALGFFLRS